MSAKLNINYYFFTRLLLFYRWVRTVTQLIALSLLFYRPVRTVTGLILWWRNLQDSLLIIYPNLFERATNMKSTLCERFENFPYIWGFSIIITSLLWKSSKFFMLYRMMLVENIMRLVHPVRSCGDSQLDTYILWKYIGCIVVVCPAYGWLGDYWHELWGSHQLKQSLWREIVFIKTAILQ